MFVCGRSAPDTPPSAGGRTAAFVAADLRDIEQVDAMLATIRAAAGGLDVLVNNAGGSPFALAADASPRFTESIVRLNLIAPLQLAQRVNAIMQPQPEGGVMLFIASVSASRPSPGTAAYGAAKAGLVNAVTSLAVEWAPRVRVCAISPSLVQTESATEGHYGDDAALDAIRATIPAGRLATPTTSPPRACSSHRPQRRTRRARTCGSTAAANGPRSCRPRRPPHADARMANRTARIVRQS